MQCENQNLDQFIHLEQQPTKDRVVVSFQFALKAICS